MFWLALPLLLAARAVFWKLLPDSSEDAYITYRYAWNFASGHGLVFNPGERVMGFTSPIWTLWSALGVVVMRDPNVWARGWSMLADCGTLFLLTRLLGRFGSVVSAWCGAIFFALWPYFPAMTMSGMEVNLMLLLIALAAWLVAEGRAGAGFALGALSLVRPEGIVCAAVIAIRARGRDRLIAAGIFVLGLAGLAMYYGSPVPQSLIAKSAIYGHPGPWAGRVWWEWLVPFEMAQWPVTQEGLQLFGLRVILAPACAFGLWKLRRSSGAIFPAACLVPWVGYALLGVSYFFWYLFVPLGGLLYLGAVGLPDLVRGRWIYVTLLLAVLGSWTTNPRKIYMVRAKEEARLFETSAEFLRENGRPEETVFAEPIGMIGFHAPQLRIIDEVGLVSPEVVRRRLEGTGWYADIVNRKRPQWIVVRAGLLKDGVALAGVGGPFRNQAELDSIDVRYQLMFQTAKNLTPEDILILGKRH